jgi:hypothetical protein
MNSRTFLPRNSLVFEEKLINFNTRGNIREYLSFAICLIFTVFGIDWRKVKAVTYPSLSLSTDQLSYHSHYFE